MEEITKICKEHIDSLPAKVQIPIREMDSDQTAEILQETEQETETELEVQEHRKNEDISLGLFGNGDLIKKELNQKIFDSNTLETPYFTLREYCRQDPLLKNYGDAFEGINLTLNVLEWPVNDPLLSDLQLLGSHRIPYHYIEVMDDGSITILSQNEGVLKKPSAYNLSFGFYDTARPVTKDLLKKIVKVKFLNGESSYSKKEQEYLKIWFQEQGVEKMRKLYQKHILAGYPEKAAAYSNSHLRNLFKELAGSKELLV